MSERKLKYDNHICFWLQKILFATSKAALKHQNHPNEADTAVSDEITYRMKGPLQSDDPALISIIKRDYLRPPGTGLQRTPNLHDVMGRVLYYTEVWVDSYLRDMYPPGKKGYFVEAGALDGVYMSNTLRLEREQGWTGLLVEPDMDNYKQLLKTNRKAWTSPTCLALNDYPETVVLTKNTNPGPNINWLGRAATYIRTEGSDYLKYSDAKSVTQYDTAQCVPARSLFLALNVSHVDFFSLDIEMTEEAVLKVFPFEDVTVDVWVIEHRWSGDFHVDIEKLNRTSNYTLVQMEQQGFPPEDIIHRQILISVFEDKNFIQFMINKGYYYLDATCAHVGDFLFVRKESEIYKAMEVPEHASNRTEICKHKLLLTHSQDNYTHTMSRDPHHYPGLLYKSLE
ncbi:uncharacterized protein LOC108681260 isoform X2 [Hyalella azteca]|uniref:Uncharacterized protein LOC108681260 isoform X2 n=1 Tax=Hyalella azteca TaxID=294128 RepID=A0A979FL36_HYAAZ|nr:uncharacterized protein LOC108681260 isoform X2 [Hyalella azteca]